MDWRTRSLQENEKKGGWGHRTEVRTEKTIRRPGSHCLPSREGSPIRLLAGLLTLASTDWPPSQPVGQWHCGQPSAITVAGPCRTFTGFPIVLSKKAPEANCFS